MYIFVLWQIWLSLSGQYWTFRQFCWIILSFGVVFPYFYRQNRIQNLCFCTLLLHISCQTIVAVALAMIKTGHLCNSSGHARWPNKDTGAVVAFPYTDWLLAAAAVGLCTGMHGLGKTRRTRSQRPLWMMMIIIIEVSVVARVIISNCVCVRITNPGRGLIKKKIHTKKCLFIAFQSFDFWWKSLNVY